MRAHVSPIAPGFQVTSSVTLERPLRHGGMGSVWVGKHASLRTQVAVKFLSSRLLTDPLSRERFSREAAAASQVKSPYVVQIFDHGVTDCGLPFIVMELLEGEDLTDRIHRGPLPAAQLSKIMGQVARALSRAHVKGIVHRDIKPDNIFLCATGDDELFVKLLDFGIAKNAYDPAGRRQTAHGAMVGTPQYMSPEQAVGAVDLDHRADLWSLGMVAYEALTGVHAFEGDTVGALVLEIHHAPLPLPSQRNPQVSAAIDQWFQKACARSRDDRFQSARELADAFAIAAGEAPVRRRSGEEASSVEHRLALPPDAAQYLRMEPPPGLVSSSASKPRHAGPSQRPPAWNDNSSVGTFDESPTSSRRHQAGPSQRPPAWNENSFVGGLDGLEREPSTSRRIERVLEPLTHGTGEEARLTLAEPVRAVRRVMLSQTPLVAPVPTRRQDGSTRGLVAAVVAIAVAAAVTGVLVARGNKLEASTPVETEPADEMAPAQPAQRPATVRGTTARRAPAR